MAPCFTTTAYLLDSSRPTGNLIILDPDLRLGKQRASHAPDRPQARLEAKPQLANPAYQPPGPCNRTKTKVAAQLTVYSAEDILHQDIQFTDDLTVITCHHLPDH
jgi:hypothetical protein